MEVVHHETPSEVSPQVEGEDFISSMPEDVITNIMNRLPLKDAVATSILSTSWRFKWTLLTQLIFDLEFLYILRTQRIHFDKTDISRLFFHLKSAVTKFVLFINNEIKLDEEAIHHWVMLLSRLGGIKELTLINWYQSSFNLQLPTHLFSCLELKHLHLNNCVLSPSPNFRGFPKLLSLTLQNVRFQDHRRGELIAQSPLLETLKISNYRHEIRGEVNLVEIAKLKNVKTLCLPLCLLDNMTMVRLSTVFQHLSLLPKLHDLTLNFGNCEFFLQFLPEDVAQNPISTTFPFLKTLTLWEMDFSSNSMSSSVFRMLFGCINLETLYITATGKEVGREPDVIDCNMIRQMQLRSVLLSNIKGKENEVCLIKSILTSSPFLNTITIHPNSSLISDGGDVKFWFLNLLLRFPRASPTAVIAVCPLQH